MTRHDNPTKVFKIGGHWVWHCTAESHGAPVGEFYTTVRDPWCVAAARAHQHADLYHQRYRPPAEKVTAS